MSASEISLHKKLKRRDLRDINKLLKKELSDILIRKKSMHSSRKLIYFLFVIMVVAFVAILQFMIITSESFIDQQKIVNSIFLWLLSSVWAIIMAKHIKPPAKPHFPVSRNCLKKFRICKN